MKKHPFLGEAPLWDCKVWDQDILTFHFILGYNRFTNKVVIVSGEEWRDSAIHIPVSTLPQTPLPSRLPHNIEQSPLCPTGGRCWLSILNTAVSTCPGLLWVSFQWSGWRSGAEVANTVASLTLESRLIKVLQALWVSLLRHVGRSLLRTFEWEAQISVPV